MTLVASQSAGSLTGFGNLLDKEMASWWRTRRWLVHLVLWLAVIGGFLLLISVSEGRQANPANQIAETMEVFFQVGGFFGLIGAVLVTQGAIVGERTSGTAAWVLTKPTTRRSFVLSKLVAITFTFLLLSVVVPAIAALTICQVFWHGIPNLVHFSEALAILALHQTFYIALTLMLGTLFGSRGPVGGVSLGFWVAGAIMPNFVPIWVTLATPWLLAKGAASIAVWKPVGFPIWIPVLATSLLGVIAVVVALWRFEREEF